MINSVEKLILGLENVYDILTSTEKIGQVADFPLEENVSHKPFKIDDELNIELLNLAVEYSASQKRVLNNISLKIRPKENILITGSSGAGKTTLLKVVAGLITPCEGQMLVNDINILNINNEHYRSFIGHVFPNNLPFDGSIKDNLTFGNPDIPDEWIKEVCHILGIDIFVKTQPKGMLTNITTDGKQLSYTMARKFILARAILNKPKFLILKDPLDEFDDDEIKRISDYIFAPKHNWSVIVASKNPIWKANCTRVIELENGHLI